MKKKPLFLGNPFQNAMMISFERAITISAYTDAALSASPAHAAEYALYHPLHVALVNAYSAWINGRGSQKSSTTTLRGLLKELTRQVRDWDWEIQAFAKKGTAEYEKFFPNGRSAFSKGKQQVRIGVLRALSDALGEVTPVPAVKSVVDDFLSDLVAVNTAQKGKISIKDTLSEAVDTARNEASEGLFLVLLKLLTANYKNPEVVGSFFDLELIRKEKQTDFTGHVAQETRRTIVKRSLPDNYRLTIFNNGPVDLIYYFTNIRNGAKPIGVTGLNLKSSESMTVDASQLGNPALDKYLTVYNASEIMEGEWLVEL